MVFMPDIQIHHQDAFVTLHAVRDSKPQLIFMDPPFNIGVEYADHRDDLPDKEYQTMLQQWIGRASNALARTGSLWVHLPDAWAAEAVVIGKSLGLTLENWIIWHYRFGQCRTERFISSKCHGLWFSRGAPVVNPETALVPSDRASIYDDLRSDGLRMDLDVWGFDRFWGRVQGNNKERRPLHPNQLPEKYLERIIRLCTRKGDLVCDPFTGSGTTPVVCSALNRNFYGGDMSLQYVRSARQRIHDGAVRVEQE